MINPGGKGASPDIYAIAKQGMMAADKIIAVSGIVKKGLIKNYGIDPDKIEVVYNGKVNSSDIIEGDFPKFADNSKVVLFLACIICIIGALRNFASNSSLYSSDDIFTLAIITKIIILNHIY